MRKIYESKVIVQMVCEAVRLDREFGKLMDDLVGLDGDARRSFADLIDAKRNAADIQIKHVIGHHGQRGWDYIDTMAESGKLALCLMVDEDTRVAS